MNKAVKMNKQDKSHQAYELQRAQDKYDGKVEGGFPVKAFRECADHLAGVLENVSFDAEDIGDLVRVALSRRGTASN